MKKLLLKYEADLKKGKIVERPNRFTLIVRMDHSRERVYLSNPGALSTVIVPGREVLYEPARGRNRKTDYNAFAIGVDDIYVTVSSIFANEIFSKVLEGGFLSEFENFSIIFREPPLPDQGRTDFLLENEVSGDRAYVEVKSCTHVENAIAKFPDRPTERGRRHLKSLAKLVEDGVRGYIVFVVQRPDAVKFQPFREVDPEFADLLKGVEESGVNVRAISTEFKPPRIYLKNKNLPISLI